MDGAEWIKTLKAGDQVAVDYGGVDSTPVIKTIDKFERGCPIVSGTKYDRRGYQFSKDHSSFYSRAHLMPVTPEIKKTIRRSYLISAIASKHNDDWRRVETNDLEIIYNILKRY